MRAEIGIKVAQDSDADGVAHRLIVLEGDGAPGPGLAKAGLEEWCVEVRPELKLSLFLRQCGPEGPLFHGHEMGHAGRLEQAFDA